MTYKKRLRIYRKRFIKPYAIILSAKIKSYYWNRKFFKKYFFSTKKKIAVNPLYSKALRGLKNFSKRGLTFVPQNCIMIMGHEIKGVKK